MDVYDLIKVHEGYSSVAYKCPAGKTTIGWGRNLDDVGVRKDEAQMMLENDVALCVHQLKQFPFWYRLSSPRQAVLIDMCYNLGFFGLCSFKRMISALEQDNFEQAAREMTDSKWYRQVGNRSKRLYRMMLNNEWPDRRK